MDEVIQNMKEKSNALMQHLACCSLGAPSHDFDRAYCEAFNHQSALINLAKDIEDCDLLFQALCDMSAIHSTCRTNHGLALRYIKEAQKLAEEEHDLGGIAFTFFIRGHIYLNWRDGEGALSCYYKASELFAEADLDPHPDFLISSIERAFQFQNRN